MKKWLFIAGAITACAFFAYGCFVVKLGDGGYELVVHVKTDGERPRWVWCVLCRDQEEACHILRIWSEPPLFQPLTGFAAVLTDPFEGEPIVLENMLISRGSYIFGRGEEHQFGHLLVVIAEMPSGRRVYKVADIPNHHVAKELTVDLNDSPVEDGGVRD